MPKGMFTQCFCLLTDGTPSLADVRAALEAEDVAILKQTDEATSWQFGGPSLLVALRPEVNGYISIDLVNECWPDSMGDPKKDHMTFGAWSMGHFGPFAYPGCLERAMQCSLQWEEGRTLPTKHRGFIRLRSSYAFGAADDAPIMPKDYEAIQELARLTELVLPLFQLDGVLCYFNPNGEVLRDAETFLGDLQGSIEGERPPVELWCNCRFGRINDDYWQMDITGNRQFDIDDVEVIFRDDKYELNQIANYLLNVTLYLMSMDREMKSGEALDGPGENQLSWITEVVENGLLPPPRQVLRLYAKKHAKAIKQLLQG